MEIKRYTNDSALNCLKKCIKAGYFPATVKQIYKLKEMGILDKNVWYDTSTIYYKNEIKDATLKDIESIESIYELGGYILSVSHDNIYSYGLRNLDVDGYFVGIKK